VAGPRREGVRETEGRRGSHSHAEEGGRYLGIPLGGPPCPSSAASLVSSRLLHRHRSEPEQRVS
jgi:hypothetical protein